MELENLSKEEDDQPATGNMMLQTREAAVDARIVEINCFFDKGQRGGGSE
jgi:hypothetical protein